MSLFLLARFLGGSSIIKGLGQPVYFLALAAQYFVCVFFPPLLGAGREIRVSPFFFPSPAHFGHMFAGTFEKNGL